MARWLTGQATVTLRQSAGLSRRFRETLAVGVGKDDYPEVGVTVFDRGARSIRGK